MCYTGFMETSDVKNPFERDVKNISEALPSKESLAENPEAQKEARGQLGHGHIDFLEYSSLRQR